MLDVTLLAVILLLSVGLQTAAAYMAMRQVGQVDDQYRMAWLIVALALDLMVERRMVPLWRHINAGEVSSMMDALFGMAISACMVVGVYGVTELITGLKSTANTDELTGLVNRRALLNAIRSEVERATRTQRPIAFLMFDLDHFKSVNDTYGHTAGDSVLQGIAHIALATFRKIDTVGRIGVFVPDAATHTVTIQNVLDATDKALYAAKDGGRNRVVVQG